MTAPLDEILHVGATRGAVLCLSMTALIVLSLRQNPRIWQDDAPPDVRARLGPMDATTRRQKSAWGAVLLAVLAGVFGSVAVALGEHGALAVFLGSYVAFQCFNLWDALVIDLSLVIVRPAWAFPPGAESSPSYRDPRWHLRNYALGVALGVPFAGLVAALDALVRFGLARVS